MGREQAEAHTAQEAYDSLAFAYDAFTAGFAHQPWLIRLERLAREHGLRGRTVLDVACGTGKSFMPLLELGYDVTGCDISEAMLGLAARKSTTVRLLQADMRELPGVDHFDLVTCLDDALNYLQTEPELIDALRGIRRNLAADGLAIWDVNTLAMYRGDFASSWAVERDGLFIVWRGQSSPAFQAGEHATAVIDVFRPIGRDCWHRDRSEHVQRHWPADTLRESARSAGLEILAVHGQHRGGLLEPALYESVHTKVVFVACRDDRPVRGEVSAMRIGSP